VVFADSLAPYVDPVYGTTWRLPAPDRLLAIYAFAFQIYFDFSGYTDIAIGIALLSRLPLSAELRLIPTSRTNLQEFWRRWHMTLSRWLRDYLYISLGGNRSATWRTQVNLMLTMLLGGLWHGASWNFVIWGGIHGGSLLSQAGDVAAWSRMACVLAGFLVLHALGARHQLKRRIGDGPVWLHALATTACLLTIILFVPEKSSPFIYFRF
jgi:D-alanyl-lipoteichoic acid acyltransferase DltB (MBOAT superfamily)